MRAGAIRAAAKIGLCITARFHAVTDRIDCIGRLDRPALALIVFDDQCEQIETTSSGVSDFGAFSKYRSISLTAAA
jgi:hypothetical protein